MPVIVGNSGWQYKHWRETFYPKGVPQRLWLEYYFERYQTVELNNSFYRLPPRETFVKWAEKTPDDFIMTVKASRYLTHIKRLKDPEEPVQRLMEAAGGLGSKLGPVLIQLPPNLQRNDENLRRALSLFDPSVRLVVEFRHDTWFVDEVKEILIERGAALSWADRGEKAIAPLWRTTDWGYVRWHQGWARPIPCYERKTMREWAKKIADTYSPDEDVFAYFNNDPRGCAPRDSIVFAEECESFGLIPTRVPKMEEVHVDTTPDPEEG